MAKAKIYLVGLLLIVLAADGLSAGISTQIREGVYKEEVEGDLDAAMKIYEQIIAEHAENQRYAAQATYRLGLCYLKKGQKDKALSQFESIVDKYPDQKKTVENAKKQIEKIKPPLDLPEFLDNPVFLNQIMPAVAQFHFMYRREAKEAGIRYNNNIFGVDESFTCYSGGLATLENNTGSEWSKNVHLINSGNPDFLFFDEQGNLIDVDVNKRDTRAIGKYSYTWDPSEPIKPGQIRTLAWGISSNKMMKVDENRYRMQMNNHFGSEVLECFFLVLPENLEIFKSSRDYSLKKNVAGHDIYVFKQMVPKNTTNRVFLTIGLEEAGSATEGSYVIHYKTVGTKVDGLELLNKNHPDVKTHHANRYEAEGETISSICTDTAEGKDKIVSVIKNHKQLELVKVEVPKTIRPAKPMVVDSFPETYSNDVSPKLDKISVTFDQTMKNGCWSWVRWNYKFPETTSIPYYDDKRTTCTLPVKLEPGTAYLVRINARKYSGFMSTDGVKAKSFVLVFATKGKDGKPTDIPDEMLGYAKRINGYSLKTVQHGALEHAQKYLNALRQKDHEAAAKLCKPYTKEAGASEHLLKMCDFKGVTIETAYGSGRQAMAVTSLFTHHKGGKAQLGITMEPVSGGWQIHDFDFLPEGKAKEFIEEFKKAYPEAILIEDVNSNLLFLEAIKIEQSSEHFFKAISEGREADAKKMVINEKYGTKLFAILKDLPGIRNVRAAEIYFSKENAIVITNGFEGLNKSFDAIAIKLVKSNGKWLIKEYVPRVGQAISSFKQRFPYASHFDGDIAKGAVSADSLELIDAPWVDCEKMVLGIKTPAGMDIGNITYTAKAEKREGKDFWVIEAYMTIPMQRMQQYTRVVAKAGTYEPVYGRTKNWMGDFVADYGDGKVVLKSEMNGQKTTKQFDLDKQVYDNEQALFMIRSMPLSVGFEQSFDIFPVQGASVIKCTINVTGKEKVKVKAGEYECYKVNLACYAGSIKALEHTLWFSADEHYLVRYDAGTAVMELSEVGLIEKGTQIVSSSEFGYSFKLPEGWSHTDIVSSESYRVSRQLISPQMSTYAVLSAVENTDPKESARAAAERDVELLKGVFKNYKVRENSWKEHKINNLQASTFIADYTDKGKAMVEYRTYIKTKAIYYWFVFRAQKDKFDELKPQYDSIINSFNINAAAISNNKTKAERVCAEGWKLWGQRKLEEAEEKFKEAARLDSTNDNALQGLGWSQFNQGKKKAAKEVFEKCIKLNPKNSAALNGLGWIAYSADEKDKAVEWWDKAIEAAPGTTASLNGLCKVYMERKKYEKAVKYYKMWLEVEPASKQAKEGLKKAQLLLKDNPANESRG